MQQCGEVVLQPPETLSELHLHLGLLELLELWADCGGNSLGMYWYRAGRKG